MSYPTHIHFALLVAAVPLPLSAQAPSIGVAAARAQARQASPEIMAAREAVSRARAQERQAGAFLNPSLSYGREQTGSGARATSQDVIAADQAFEWPGVRSARQDAARARREAAEARLSFVEWEVALHVTRAYATAAAAERRARLADTVARAFATALVVSEQRLREGDISGFAARRTRLEAARYAALRAEATLAQRTARVELAALVADSAALVHALAVPAIGGTIPTNDSLVAMALTIRGDLAASQREVDAASADARRAARERVPFLTLTGGTKSEELPGGERLSGFVAGVAVPLPLWDRRGGAIAAAGADARRRAAEALVVRRRVSSEVVTAADALRAAQAQLALLGPSVQGDAEAALRSAQTAYAEGEITLWEWVDTVRAYQETETTIANLRADLVIRAAVLERAVGTSLFPELR